MNTSINANAVIIINDLPFKANDEGLWNLTEIWKVLKLADNKRPSQWDNKEAKALKHSVEISTLKVGKTSQVFGSKFATLQYAGWVSFEFSRMVYAAFESILAIPEVAAVVANKMVELGHKAEAELLERHTNADRDFAHAELKKLKGSARSRQWAAKKRELYRPTAASIMKQGSR